MGRLLKKSYKCLYVFVQIEHCLPVKVEGIGCWCLTAKEQKREGVNACDRIPLIEDIRGVSYP